MDLLEVWVYVTWASYYSGRLLIQLQGPNQVGWGPFGWDGGGGGHRCVWLFSRKVNEKIPRWWFQIFFIFAPTWVRFLF